MLDAMLPYMVTQYGNPHSRTHAYGWESEEAVEKARKVKKEVLFGTRKCSLNSTCLLFGHL